MKPKIRTNFFLVIVVTLLSASGASAAGIGNNIVVLLAGEGSVDVSGNQFTQLGLVAPEGVLCFDIDLFDAKTGNVIGSGSDCLSDINPFENGGMSLTATTFFYFPGGTLVSQGQVTVQPKLPGLVLDGLEEFTHVTGAAPSPSDNNVIYGDGKFKTAAGSVRLSGLVNLSKLGSEGKIFFDCVFVIDI